MDPEELQSTLKELNNYHPQILLSMIVNLDGLMLAYEGNVDNPEGVGAQYIELQLECTRLIAELNYGELEEMFFRSDSGCLAIFPIRDKGLLACMSTPDVNSAKMQMFTWKTVNRLVKIM